MGAAARYTAVAMTLPSATIAGYLIGYGLDHWLGTTYLKIVCLILGIVGGFYGVDPPVDEGHGLEGSTQVTTLPIELSVTRITRIALVLGARRHARDLGSCRTSRSRGLPGRDHCYR